MSVERDALFEQRLRKAEELREMGHDPYANDFRVDTQVSEFYARYSGLAAEDLEKVDQIHAVSGRVMAINTFGKAAFIRLQDGSVDAAAHHCVVATSPATETASPAGAALSAASASSDAHAAHAAESQEAKGRLQIYIRKERVGDDAFAVFKKLDLGDFVGITGTPMRTKTGELTLLASSLKVLTKTLRPLPEKWHGLSDLETRYRQRYLDLIVNAGVRDVFRMRSQIVQAIRTFFYARDFLEVETPMLQSVAGGAAARPFVTHHNALGLDLALRIAPELHLKRLVVGGFDRVFEINRCFRNEGISTFHNPEFTTLEFYQAYATYLDLMDLGEALIAHVAKTVLPYVHGGKDDRTVTWGQHQISLESPFRRMTMVEAIAAHGGPSPDDARNPEIAGPLLRKLGVDIKGMRAGHMIVALFEHFAESKLIQPTYIYDFPLDVSPLSRRKDGAPELVDRFELFVGGKELANAFSELNDPLDQRHRFEMQLAARAAGDEEAHSMDEDFVRALEHGMPPTAGFGLGIDRFVMLLTGSTSIRDVILFPQLRPER